MKRILIIMCFLLVLSTAAFADGYSDYGTGDYLGSPYAGGIAVVCSKNITIRTEPSYDGSKVQSASNGDILYVESMSGNWLEITYIKNGNYYNGWVIASYVVLEPLTLTLRSSNIPAYCAPDKSSKLVGSLAKGTELTVLGTWGDFYIVNLREASAFISMDADFWTSKDLYWSISTSRNRAVTLRQTKMRSGPGTEWKELMTVPSGEIVTVGENNSGWVLISYQGITGFVRETDLQITYVDDGNG